MKITVEADARGFSIIVAAVCGKTGNNPDEFIKVLRQVAEDTTKGENHERKEISPEAMERVMEAIYPSTLSTLESTK
jgi:hypothetical protein